MRERVAAVAVAAALFACGGPGPGSDAPSEEAPSYGGTAVVATGTDFDAFNELATTSAIGDQVIGHVLFQNLLRYDEGNDYAYAPALADTFWVAEDGMSATFHVREEARWHDGVPVTADDVVWSFEMSKLDVVAYPDRASIQFVERAEKLDERTVRFTFNALHAEPLADFAFWTPMPKHLLEDVPPAEMANAPFNRNPVGNGPFRFVEWRPNESVVFEANEDFWAGRPYLDRIVFRVIPETTTAITELETGGVDVYRNVPPRDLKRFESGGNVRPLTYPSLGFTYVLLNLERPMFDDVRARRAVTEATDRQGLIDGLVQGYAEMTAGPVSPQQWEKNEALDPWPYDPAEAARLLDEAGWTDRDGDGIRDRDGRPFRFEILTNTDNALRNDLVVAMQSMLKEVGIDARPRAAEFNTVVDKLLSGDFDAILLGWDLYLRFDVSPLLETDATYNGGHYSNPRADDLMRRASQTLDRAAAKPSWDEYQRVIHEDQPFLFLYADHERWAVSGRMRGVEPAGAPNAFSPLASVARWWIPPRAR